MCTNWCKSKFQPLKSNSLTPHEDPEVAKIVGSVVCGSKVDITNEIRAREYAATDQSFIFLIFEGLCGATVTLFERLDCRTPYSWCTNARANHRHDREIAEFFRLLSAVYHDAARSRLHQEGFLICLER